MFLGKMWEELKFRVSNKKMVLNGVAYLYCYYFWFMHRNDYYNISKLIFVSIRKNHRSNCFSSLHFWTQIPSYTLVTDVLNIHRTLLRYLYFLPIWIQFDLLHHLSYSISPIPLSSLVLRFSHPKDPHLRYHSLGCWKCWIHPHISIFRILDLKICCPLIIF